MAKKLAKAQLGKIVKTAVKTIAKEAKPVVKAVKKPSFMDFRTTDTKNMMHDALEMQERARLKAHLQSLSKKQEGGPMDGDKSRPSITARPKQTPKPKKDVLNPNSNRVVPRNFVAPGKPAAPGSAAYPLEHFKPFKPTVAKKGGAVKTKKK